LRLCTCDNGGFVIPNPGHSTLDLHSNKFYIVNLVIAERSATVSAYAHFAYRAA
jgi:hypothetical protein